MQQQNTNIIYLGHLESHDSPYNSKPISEDYYEKATEVVNSNTVSKALRKYKHEIHKLAKNLKHQGSYKKAIHCFEAEEKYYQAKTVINKMDEIQKKRYRHCLNSLGECHMESNDYTKAKEYFLLANKLGDDYWTNYHLGVALHRNKDYKEAAAWFDMAVEMIEKFVPRKEDEELYERRKLQISKARDENKLYTSL